MSASSDKIIIDGNGWTEHSHRKLFKTVNKKKYRIVEDGSIAVTYQVQIKRKFLFFTWWADLRRNNGYYAQFMKLKSAIDWVESGAETTKVLWSSKL